MVTFRKINEMYVAYDENDNLQYGYIVKGNNIKEFVLLNDNMPEEIVLPQIRDEKFFDNNRISNMTNYEKKELEKTIGENSIKLGEECFTGYDNLNIVVPYSDNITIKYGCFDIGSNVNFKLKDGLGLKEITRVFDTGIDYESENWTAITSEKLNGVFSVVDSYEINDYDLFHSQRYYNNSNMVNFSISYIEDEHTYNK